MNSSDRLSVIICSIDPDKCRDCTDSLRRTAGINLEIRVIDNRGDSRPIADIYNEGAELTSAPYLMFIHEDVIISNNGWGWQLIQKLSEPSTGVIGFAGSTLRVPVPGGWDQGGPEYMRASLRHVEDGVCHEVSAGAVSGETFRQVITVDGLAMAVRRDVWADYPFDQHVLDGFHCYDIDFSVEIAAAGYQNYVMYGVDVLHLSSGSYNETWMRATLDMFYTKWSRIPVMSVDPIDTKSVNDAKCRCLYGFIFKAIRSAISDGAVRRLMQLYRDLPSSASHYYRHLLTLKWQQLRYRD